MRWSLPPDPQFAIYAHAPPLLLTACAIIVAWGVFEVRRGNITARHFARLAATLAGGLAILGGAWGLAANGPQSWELAVRLQFIGVAGFAAPLAWFASFPFALAASLAPFIWCARNGRWKEAYLSLAAGPGLAVAGIALKLAYPRIPPTAQPFFAGPTAFVDVAAALWLVVLLLYSVVVGGRKRWLQGGLMVLAVLPWLTGISWTTDFLAGLGLAVAWGSACLLAYKLAQASGSASNTVLTWLDVRMQRIILQPRPWLLALLSLGVGLRLASYWTSPLAVDAYSYSVLGHSLLAHGNLVMPWGDVDTFQSTAVASHHYPPLYPIYLAGFYKILGFTQGATRVAAIVSSLAALAGTYLCTRDLYGKGKALLVTAILSLSPLLVQNTGQGYSENLVLLLFVATLWAILRSLERPWFIVAAGLLAGLGYLAKSSMGYFFIIAGLGGLAWRLRWRGLKVLRDPSYLTAIVAFGLVVAGWALRNFLLFRSWETSVHLNEAYANALAHPVQWAYLALVTSVFYIAAGYLLFLALLPWVPRLARIPRLESEHDSGLWLALGLPLVLTAVIDAALWLSEGEFFLNNVRYIAFVMVPAALLLVRHADLGQRGTRLALLLTVVLLISGALFFAKPTASPTQAIADDLAPRLAPIDSVGFVDKNNHFAYRFYFQFTDGGTHDRAVELACIEHPLCPADVPRASTLNTTWVLAPAYAASQLADRYHTVPGAVATADPAYRESLQLWRHN